MSDPERFLTTSAAATRLGVTRDTLYAYVSRGRLRAHRRANHRGSWFDPVDVDALVRRARAPAERRPDVSVRSAITLIEEGRYWYRGQESGGAGAHQQVRVGRRAALDRSRCARARHVAARS